MDQAEQLRNIIKAGNVKRSRPLARVITVTSGKGGVGKSNTAINLAIQFRKMGKKVVMLDWKYFDDQSRYYRTLYFQNL